MTQPEDATANEDKSFSGITGVNNGHTNTAAALILPKWPRKSILKHKHGENATVPITFGILTAESPPLRPLDRRVSFAEKVQLHKIDVVPFSAQNGQNLSSDGENEPGESDSDEDDEDTSFLALEADADKVATMLRANNGGQASNSGLQTAESDNNGANLNDSVQFTKEADFSGQSVTSTGVDLADESDNASEDSMELTGPVLTNFMSEKVVEINQNDHTKAVDQSEAHNIESVSTSHLPGSDNLQDILKLPSEAVESSNFQLHHVTSRPEQEDHGDPANSESNHPLFDLSDSRGQEDANAHISDAVLYPQASPEFEFQHLTDIAHTDENLALQAPSLTSSEDYLDGEEEMELTLHVARFDYEELTMELTLPQPSNLASLDTRAAGFESAIGVFETGATNGNELESKDEIEEATMELTKQVIVEARDPVLENEETTMEFTKPIESTNFLTIEGPQEIATVREIESDEETAMELTQPVSTNRDIQSTPSQEPQAQSTQIESRDSPVHLRNQESAEIMQPGKMEIPEQEDLSIIQEESEAESQAEVNIPAETVQTPTNEEYLDDNIDIISNADSHDTRAKEQERDSRSSSVSSLSDINIYPDSNDENSAGKHALGPAMNPSPIKRHKPQNDESNSTKKAEESGKSEEIVYNDDWSVPEISLPGFLEEIGIKFYDDLEIATDVAARYQQSSLSGPAKFPKEAYYTANIRLPLLEVYELSCKELAAKIEQGKRLFDEVKERSVQNNPLLFKQYLSASPFDQTAMRAKFHLMKEYTKQQAKEVWYEWRKKLISNILQVYQNNLEVLENDKLILESGIEELELSFKSMIRDLEAVNADVKRFKEIQSNFQGLEIEDIKRMRARMADLNRLLLDHKRLIAANEKSISALQQSINNRRISIDALKNQVREAEDELSKTKQFSSKEIEELQILSQLWQTSAGLKYVDNRDGSFAFELDPQIGIVVDKQKLETHDGLKCQVNPSAKSTLCNESLIQHFPGLVDALTASAPNAFEKFRTVRKIWTNLRLVDMEVYRIKFRFPLDLRAANDNLIDFLFDYLSPDAKSKINFSVSIPLKGFLQYPECVTVDAQVIRGEGEHAQMTKSALEKTGRSLTMFTRLQS
ncbi:Spc7-C2 protein [Metschnikowia aff. pulcherrima]|uniref:Spc7-C2 protein n=1 Tax=Metschnikowia aff. pulcherrima TaxID=2163413 RepID=A0A4P6XMU5_9ASCO|nr:Spc7-C2 protein [Metschnikowia aff. pulcherrima]